MNTQNLSRTSARLINTSRSHRLASSALALITLVLAFSAVAAMSRAAKTITPRSPSAGDSQQILESAGQRAKEKIGSESIAITRHGLEPREISRVGGRFFLLVENRSGVNPLVFRVTAQSGSRLKEFTLTRDQLDWADEVNIPEGQYTITEVNHGWTCHLTITAAP
jgi:hypothetical protein